MATIPFTGYDSGIPVGSGQLELCLAGVSPGPWSRANLEFLRTNFLSAALASPISDAETGATVLTFGQMTEIYNMTNGLDLNNYDSVDRDARNSVGMVDTALQSCYAVIPSAINEVAALGLTKPYTDILSAAIYGDSAKYRVSGIATLLTMAAILQIHG